MILSYVFCSDLRRLVYERRVESGLSAVQVEQDGSYKIADGSSRGGRTFHGLGTLLTGYKVKYFSKPYIREV